MRTGCLIAVGLVFVGAAPAMRAAPDGPEPFAIRENRALVTGVIEQMRIDRAICVGELELAIEQKMLTREHFGFIQAWLSAFDPANLEVEHRDLPFQDVLEAYRRIDTTRPPQPLPFPSEAARGFAARRVAMLGALATLLSTERRAALDTLEEAWLQASNPAELIRAADQLDQAARFPKRPYRFPEPLLRRPAISPIWMEELELNDARIVIGGEQPLLLPEASSGFTAPASRRALWKKLQAEQNLFLQRPKIAARIAQSEARFLAAYRDAEDAVVKTLREGAPAAECLQKFERLLEFESPPISARERELNGAGLQTRTQASPHAAPEEPNRSAEFVSWMAIIARATQQTGPLTAAVKNAPRSNPPPASRVGTFFREWWAIVHGPTFDSSPATWLIEKYDVDGPHQSSEQAMLSLVRDIAAISNPESFAAELRTFAGAWEKLRANPWAGNETFATASACLTHLAPALGGHFLFKLRADAGRSALDSLVPNDPVERTDELGMAIRARLERAIEKESFELALRLVALADLTQSLPQSITQSYRDVIQKLRLLPETTGRPQIAELLAQPTSPAAVTVTLRRLGAKL